MSLHSVMVGVAILAVLSFLSALLLYVRNIRKQQGDPATTTVRALTGIGFLSSLALSIYRLANIG
jgi:hypothetical protein